MTMVPFRDMSRFVLSRKQWIVFPLILLAVIVGLVGIALARSIPDLTRAVADVREGRRLLASAAATWERDRYAGIHAMRMDLNAAERVLARASDRLDSAALLEVIPVVRGVLRAATDATAGASALAGGASRLTSIAVDAAAFAARVEDRSYNDLSAGERAEALQMMGSALTSVRVASDALTRGERLLASARCPASAAALLSVCRDLSDGTIPPHLRGALQQVYALAAVTDRIAASVVHDAPTDILLLYLNNMELRPGGGFLGTYGLLRVARGQVQSFTTDDVYTLDKTVVGALTIDPPAPFRNLGIVRYWYLRDANWSPDFVESSRTVLDFYRREGGPGVPTMVVGLTPTFAANLLTLVGPITVNGVRFDAANIADELEYQVEKAYYTKGIPEPRRKDIIAPLSRAVLDGFLNLPFRTWRDAFDRTRAAVEERQLMAYATDPVLQETIDRLGAAGRVRTRASGEDAFMTVDANLGSLKTDAVIDRSITYTIRPDTDGGYRGTIALTYRNTGTFTWKTTRYQTYTRVYLPPGTHLLGASGATSYIRGDRSPGTVDRYEELGRTVFGAFLRVEPGETRTLVLDIQIAPDVVASIGAGRYHLAVQKQLGTPRPTRLTVDHTFATMVDAATPPEVPAAWGDNRYMMETDLRVDRQFAVVMSLP